LTPEALKLTRPYRKIVSVRVPDELAMLEKCLVETDPDTTEIVVVAAHASPPRDSAEVNDVVDAAHRAPSTELRLTDEHRRLMTAVVNRSELAAKPIKPMVVLTEDPIAMLIQAARTLGATELILGPSDLKDADTQIDQVASLWSDARGARSTRLTIRVIGKESDQRRDVAGGCQIPSAPDSDGETARSPAASGSTAG
jgi:hypothetical protein